MSTPSPTRAAWLDIVGRSLLGLALLAAVAWALTDGGNGLTFFAHR
jgi:hypothetical protein